MAASVFVDRVYETTVTTGTGAITMAGAVLGYFTFAAKLANPSIVDYCIVDPATGAVEVGQGTWTTTLSRDTIYSSSNANAAVNFAAGTKHVFVTAAAISLTKAAIVPNTPPAAGEILIGNAGGTAYAKAAMSGDATISSAGVLSLTKPLLFAVTSSVNALSNVNTAQNIFPSGFDELAVEASTSYFFDAVFQIITGTNAYSVSINFAGTATITSIGYQATGIKVATGGISTNINNRFVSTAATQVLTTANATGGALIELHGVIRINGAGSLIPQLTFSAAPGGTNQLEANSFMKLVKIGSDTVTSFGPWT